MKQTIYVDGKEDLVFEGQTAWENFAKLLRAKHCSKVKWITKIVDNTNYDGTRTTTVFQDNGVKSVFVYKD